MAKHVRGDTNRPVIVFQTEAAAADISALDPGASHRVMVRSVRFSRTAAGKAYVHFGAGGTPEWSEELPALGPAVDRELQILGGPGQILHVSVPGTGTFDARLVCELVPVIP